MDLPTAGQAILIPCCTHYEHAVMRTPAGFVGMRLLYRYMYLYKEILAGHTYPDLQNRPPRRQSGNDHRYQ
jgi:hypothetical protein